MDVGYYRNERLDVIRVLPQKPRRVLELGCGAGVFGKRLKDDFGCTVEGIELFKEAAEEAATRLDKVHLAELESFDFSSLNKKFDLIVANDVLEHLKDPWSVLSKVRSCLTKDGYVVVSIPNVRYYKVVQSLLFKGEWKYMDSGVLDSTHIRFFTKKSIIEMFDNAGYALVKIKPNIPGPRGHRVKRLTNKLFEEFCAIQYLVVARLS